jgi:hypothetical protein
VNLQGNSSLLKELKTLFFIDTMRVVVTIKYKDHERPGLTGLAEQY